jgi:hypothetical protein
MSNCPNCSKDPGRPRWAPGACLCKHDPAQQDGDLIDDILEAGSKWDYITPAAEATGANKYVLFVLALVGVAGVFLSHGVLWGG